MMDAKFYPYKVKLTTQHDKIIFCILFHQKKYTRIHILLMQLIIKAEWAQHRHTESSKNNSGFIATILDKINFGNQPM